MQRVCTAYCIVRYKLHGLVSVTEPLWNVAGRYGSVTGRYRALRERYRAVTERYGTVMENIDFAHR